MEKKTGSKRPMGRRRNLQSKFDTPFWKKKYSVEDIARASYQGVQQLRRLVNVEEKFQDIYVSNSPNNSTYTNTFVSHLSAIAQGDTVSSREGNSVKPLKLQIKGHVVMNASATYTTVRLIVVKDMRQEADVIPATSTIINTASGFVVNNPYNRDSDDARFKHLADVRLITSTDNPLALFEIDVPLRGHIRWNGTLGSDIEANGHYLCAVSDQNTNLPTVTWSSRLTYVDN